MSQVSIAFFGTMPYDKATFREVNEQYGFDIKYYTGNLSLNNVSLTQGVEVVCIFVNDDVDAELIQHLKDNGVRLIALRCAGYNNVDIAAAQRAGIAVVRVPAYSPHAVAEYAVALMLSLNRKIQRASWRTRDGNFSLNGLMGFDMYGKTLGVIGTGKIAKVLIGILRGFGMKILAYDLYPDHAFAEANDVRYVTLDELYAASDIISLHCPLTPETEYIINRESIAKMKRGVMIINTGRGRLIHSEDLIEGLKTKQVGFAGLDVYEEEEPYFYKDKSDKIIDDDTLARLLSFNNVIMTSHQAFFTAEATQNIAHTTLSNVRDFVEGRPLLNAVHE
ncbi:2-hydroxyacid dehydrogenase [uncultured Porphyromonas sp.]|jgi:D-lactate dehydrogenase|uniref:2-hydroxyacid dehydrogenase n=1 Tax=uncultured Porphyromonas sp. TaxID=159274 RepID=UPI00261BA0BE|nr:2-hydroxyacid dehydrogenase [uncultured Porphyromonas sp.]